MYVTDFADGNAKITMLDPWSDVSDIFQWSIYQFYVMDSTGRYLLADGYLHNAESDPGDLRLVLIDMHDLSYEIIGNDSYFSVATFVHDDQQAFYVSSKGAFAYDRQTKTSTLLTDDIDSSEIMSEYYQTFFPSFSPDGHFLAAQIAGEEGERKLYLYPIPPTSSDKTVERP
jgi:hypothetical protein